MLSSIVSNALQFVFHKDLRPLQTRQRQTNSRHQTISVYLFPAKKLLAVKTARGETLSSKLFICLSSKYKSNGSKRSFEGQRLKKLNSFFFGLSIDCESSLLTHGRVLEGKPGCYRDWKKDFIHLRYSFVLSTVYYLSYMDQHLQNINMDHTRSFSF